MARRPFSFFILGLGLGLLGLAAALTWLRWQPPAVPALAPTPVADATPAILSLPTLDLRLPLSPATMLTPRPSVTDSGVTYLPGQGALGADHGNLVLYGHNWPGILGKLPKLAIGDQVIITARDGREFVYQIMHLQTVHAWDQHIIQDTASPRVTIYTCTGLFDRDRFVAVGLPLIPATR